MSRQSVEKWSQIKTSILKWRRRGKRKSFQYCKNPPFLTLTLTAFTCLYSNGSMARSTYPVLDQSFQNHQIFTLWRGLTKAISILYQSTLDKHTCHSQDLHPGCLHRRQALQQRAIQTAYCSCSCTDIECQARHITSGPPLWRGLTKVLSGSFTRAPRDRHVMAGIRTPAACTAGGHSIKELFQQNNNNCTSAEAPCSTSGKTYHIRATTMERLDQGHLLILYQSTRDKHVTAGIRTPAACTCSWLLM